MPVPSTIADLSTTAGSNYPQGTDTPTTGDDVFRAYGSFIATLRDQLNGTANTGTVKNAALSGTHTGASAFSGLQTFSAGVNVGNSASATATTLDWYEEGTTTPTIAGSSAAGTGTYTTQTGTWTRVGNRVDFYLEITWTAHTGTGNVRIVHGFPYLPSAAQLLPGQLQFEAGTGSVKIAWILNSSSWQWLTLNEAQTGLSSAAQIVISGRYFL